MALDLSLTATFNFSFEKDEEGIKYSVGSIDHSRMSLEEMTTLSEILKYIDDEKIADIIRVHLLNTIQQLQAAEELKNSEAPDTQDTRDPKDESTTESGTTSEDG